MTSEKRLATESLFYRGDFRPPSIVMRPHKCGFLLGLLDAAFQLTLVIRSIEVALRLSD
jgi:hypothetical protein